MLQEQKFDAILTTKRNKNLGYDDRTGRFFELTSSESSTAVDSKLDTEIGHAPVQDETLMQNDDEKLVMDVPQMPQDGFIGMNITGEINGVKMTSSKQSMKRKIVLDDEPIPELETVTTKKKNNFVDQMANSGAVSAAAMATAAVNAAVSMKTLQAPSTDKSYISLDSGSKPAVDTEGLPLVYDKDLIETYWKKERGALNQRWSYFVGKAVPFLTRLVTLFIAEGEINERHIPGLSRQARMDLQDLGPTFIKAGELFASDEAKCCIESFGHFSLCSLEAACSDFD